MLAIARSTESRSAVCASRAPLSVEIAELQHSVGPLDEFLDPNFGFVQLFRCPPQKLDPFLEEAERCIQVEPVVLELRDDFFQSGQIFFEGQSWVASISEQSGGPWNIRGCSKADK